jgi:hypothetical protein
VPETVVDFFADDKPVGEIGVREIAVPWPQKDGAASRSIDWSQNLTYSELVFS